MDKECQGKNTRSSSILGPSLVSNKRQSNLAATYTLNNFYPFSGIIFNTKFHKIKIAKCMKGCLAAVICPRCPFQAIRRWDAMMLGEKPGLKLKFYVGWNCQSALYCHAFPEFYLRKQESDNLWPTQEPIQYQQDLLLSEKNRTWPWKQQWDSVNQWICRSFVLCFHATGVNHKLEKVWREFSNIVSVPLLFYFDLLSLIDHCFLLFDILLFSFYLDLLPLIRATVCYFLGDLRRKRI